MTTTARPPLASLEEALSQVLAPLAGPLGDERIEWVDTFDADGRVLARDVTSPLQVPPQDNSSMDGYALRAADVAGASASSPVVLPVSQRIAAGQSAQALARASVARIFTGAPMPEGADAVLMQEDAQVLAPDAGTASADGLPVRIAVSSPVAPGLWVRRSGEDIVRGATVLAAGRRLGPAELGLAASVGAARLAVARRPRVALFSTGDELVMPGAIEPQHMPAGAIYNSNRFFLRSLLRRCGAEVSDLGIVPDRREATVAALRDAARSNDLILTSGGVSVGEEDHVKPAVQALGTLRLWQIAIKPGKPFANGQVGAGGGAAGAVAHFMGLPGNPVSSFVTFLLLVRPFLLRWQGVADVALPTREMRADFDWPRPDKRREFLRVRVNAQGGLDLFANQSSGVLTSVAWADGVVDTAPQRVIRRGDAVPFVAWSDCLN